MPLVTFAGCLGELGVLGGMEDEVQGVHLNAAIGVLVAESVIPAGGVRDPMPLVTVTGRHGNRGVLRFMDRQVKRVPDSVYVTPCHS